MLTVVAGLLPAGALAGALWAWLAPPVNGVVALTHSGERLHDYLGDESDHFFVAAFLMLGPAQRGRRGGAGAGWQWRAHRGPEMVVALWIGMVDRGRGCDRCRRPAGPLTLWHSGFRRQVPLSHDHPLHYFIEAAPVFFGPSPLQVACTLLLPAATAALVYAVLAAATRATTSAATRPSRR